MRAVRASFPLLCLTLISGAAGCFKHHELDESAIQPLAEDEPDPTPDAGLADPPPLGDDDGDGDGRDGDDGDGDDGDGDDGEPGSACDLLSDPAAQLLCALTGGGDLQGILDLLGGLPTNDECDAMPDNVLAALLCGLNGGQPPLEPPTDEVCETTTDPFMQFLCGLRDNVDPEPEPVDPLEGFRDFIESLFPTAEQCEEPDNGLTSFFCRLVEGGLLGGGQRR